MFETTHRSLTKYYVTVTVALFTIMVACFLAVMTWTLYNNEQAETLAFAREEASEYINFFEKGMISQNLVGHQSVEEHEVTKEEIHNALRMFSLLKLPNGEFFPITFMTTDIEKWAKGIITEKDLFEPELVTYKIDETEHRRIFLVAHDIFVNETFYGTIYAGKDVTIIWQIIKQMLIFTLVLILIFTYLLFRFGSSFASKAMLPVEEALVRQKRFIADASHELRTPLSVILTGTDVIKSDREIPLAQANKEIIDDIQDEVRKMSKLVENLLNLSKIDEEANGSGTQEDVVHIAMLTIKKLLPLAQVKKIKLVLNNENNINWVTDGEILAQALYILIDNAIKYTPANGTVTVQIDTPQNKNLHISVKDNGIGVPDEEQTRIFERFYRVDKARSRQEGSSGLGLSIAKVLIEKQSGSIQVCSKLGQGSVFTIILPAK